MDDNDATTDELAVPGPVSIVDGLEHQVDPRSVPSARLVVLPFIVGLGLIPAVVFTLVWTFGPMNTVVYRVLIGIWLLAYCVALGIGYKWPALSYRFLRYRVDETGVTIRRGVLWRKVISIPTSRVQHTDVEQGPLQRHYGIATLTVHTAGTAGASIPLSGLEHGVAKRLRDHLLPEHERDAV